MLKLSGTQLTGMRSRKGFALILVFSLASIILLLSLSLVSLTQVETASRQYDQGLKVARANARLALQLAIGDLQEFTGPDQRVTATADGLRTDGTNPAETSFNLPAAGGVEQPFWTGVWDVDNTSDDPVWLVTRPVDANYTIDNNLDQVADPTATAISGYGTSNELVKLVGVGSAKPEPTGGSQAVHDVFVPKEPLISDKIVGLTDTEQVTIGHYAYWVGDNGVKASYLIEDDLPETLYDIYETSSGSGIPTYEQFRLKQMLAHRFYFDVDGTKTDATNARIESIASDLILRKELEGTPKGRSYLGMSAGTYTQNDVLRRFHDFTGMSRGLIVDTIRGGLREDLSNIHAVDVGSTAADDLVDDLVNNYLMPYLNVSDFPTVASPSDLRRAYPIAPKTPFGLGGPTPTISPVITEFWMVIRMSAPNLEIGAEGGPRRSDVYGQFGVVVELWNPYTSRINGADLRIRIENPHTDGLVVNYYDNYTSGDPPTVSNALPGFGLEDVMNNVSEFHLDTSGTWWEPGEVRTFKGSYHPVTGILDLTTGTVIPTGSTYDYRVSDLPTYESSDTVYTSDRFELVGPPWTPEISLRTSGGDELYRFSLDGISFYEMRSSPKLITVGPERHLSYKWELRNPDSTWINYDPRSGSITTEVIMESFVDPSGPPISGYIPESMFFYEYPGGLTPYNNSNVQSSLFDLLGYNDDASIENNIPLFELPRQEFISLAGLQMAEFPSGIKGHLGEWIDPMNPITSINEVFDRFFLSTVPQSGSTTWTVGDPLPNSRMEPTGGTIRSDLQAPDSAEHLFLNGAFNVNSTSFEAWTAMLKGVRLENWAYDDPSGSTPVMGQSELLDVNDENQFFRFSQTAEETWLGSYSATDLDKSRAFFRQGMRSLTDAEIATLATEIIEAIRTRRQAGSTPLGPFVSLQDFIDSGVLETAIAQSSINDSIRTDLADPTTELAFSSSYLTQQDILTAIAPYLTVRSDTFVIRAYGDAVNPFDDTEVVARAYCEAIVQRVHTKHSTESSPDPMTATDNTAGALGRNFRIIAFRWLTGDEI